MGNYENLKQSITEVIRTNGNQEITGAVLQNTLLTIISSVGANATFAGIATPTTNPGTPDGPVFYLASEGGTYSNFNAIELQAGLSVLMWNGTWSSQQIFSVDDVPTAGSDNLVKSGGVQEELALGAVYDVSAKNPTAGVNNDGKFESLSALLEDANLDTLIPASVRKGGMSIKFVQSSDNKYVQYRYMLQYENTTEGNNSFVNAINWRNIESEFISYANSLRFYDEDTESYDSEEVRQRSAVVLEMYVDGEPFEENNPLEFSRRYTQSGSYEQVAFIRKNDDLWAFAFNKTFGFTGITLEKVSYAGRTIYAVINWSAPSTTNATHSHVIVSEGCYSLDNNPAISAYVKKNQSSAELYVQKLRLDNHDTHLSNLDTHLSNLDTHLSNQISKQIALDNSKRFYDITAESYSSQKVRERRAVVLELYVDGEPFEDDNPLEFARFTLVNNEKQLAFIRQNSSTWDFFVNRALDFDDITFITAQISGRTVYIIANFDAEYTSDDVHSHVIVSDGCYSLDNNPAISAYIKKNQLDAQITRLDTQISRYPSLPKKIICSGSSITWGNGKFDDSMVLYIDKFVKEKLSTTVLPTQMTFPQGYTIVNQAMMYNNSGHKISNIGDTVEFDSYGDEIAICQMKRRTKTDFGIVNVYADDVLIGRFDNKNFIGSETEIFSDSNIREIRLKHPCTFNHAITINGATVLSRIIYNKAGYGGTVPSDPTTFDAFVFRALDENGHPVHRIQFSTALGTITSVNISYDYGNIIAHERSTLGQTADEYENESYYGSGSVSYDPAHPTSGISSGMEFRGINKESFFVHKFTSTKMRHFKLELIDGNNPYFIINFATNRYNDMMNAGIGGWTIAHLINMDKWCDYTEFFKWFKPEIIFQESETNDDWSYGTRRIRRNIGEITLAQLQKLHWLEVYAVTYNSSTDKYNVDMCTGIISSITYTSLISQDIIGTQTQVGDIIRIGNYHGDIKQITCRRITEVNLETGEVKWVEPISFDELMNVDSFQDLIGAEINIRDLSGYKNAYKTYIEKVHEIAPEATVVVVDNGLPMLGTRQLWGYDVIHREIVAETQNSTYCDARDVLYKGQFDNVTGTRKETITPDGSPTYNLTFGGASKSWCGFKVFVNGIDVYGRDCYIECQYAYRAKSSLSGAALNKISPYDRSQASDSTEGLSMKLVFIKNIPTANDTVEVWYSDEIWSGDYCHPSGFGAFLYGQAYAKFIDN